MTYIFQNAQLQFPLQVHLDFSTSSLVLFEHESRRSAYEHIFLETLLPLILLFPFDATARSVCVFLFYDFTDVFLNNTCKPSVNNKQMHMIMLINIQQYHICFLSFLKKKKQPFYQIFFRHILKTRNFHLNLFFGDICLFWMSLSCF